MPVEYWPTAAKNLFQVWNWWWCDSTEDALAFSLLSWHVKLNSCPCSTSLSSDIPGWNGKFRNSLENIKSFKVKLSLFNIRKEHLLGKQCFFGNTLSLLVSNFKNNIQLSQIPNCLNQAVLRQVLCSTKNRVCLFSKYWGFFGPQTPYRLPLKNWNGVSDKLRKWMFCRSVDEDW